MIAKLNHSNIFFFICQKETLLLHYTDGCQARTHESDKLSTPNENKAGSL
jgi:hypothetical protein